MKTIVFLVAVIVVATAVPKPHKLHYRNLFKTPKEITSRPSPRIIGGQEAEPHSIPFQAFLEVYSGNSGWYCGGSLISENYVLTAGHCGDEATEAHITLGAHKPLEAEDTQVQIISKEVTVHADYDSENIVNDIAVIKLPEAVALTDAIQPVVLPSSADNTYEGATATISGWGLTDGFGDSISEVLNYVNVKAINNTECESYFGDLPDSNLCTSGDENSGSCSGDSGGPVVVDGVQVGVVSFGVIFCLPGYPSGHTRVTSFLDWIAANSDVQI